MRKLIPGLLLLVFSVICVTSYSVKSPTFDEIQHLSSGYLTLVSGKLDIGMGHPPLFRVLIAAPLTLLHPSFNPEHPLLKRRLGTDPVKWADVMYDYVFGFDLFYRTQGNNPSRLFFWGRLIAVLLGVGGGLIVYRFSRQLYGPPAAVFSLFLYSFSPTIIAHSRLTVNDISGAAGILLMLFAYYRYMQKESVENLIALSVISALAVLTKFNALIASVFVVAGIALFSKKKPLIKTVVFIGVNMAVIDLAYGFGGVFSVKEVDYAYFSTLIPLKILDRPAYYLFRLLPLPYNFLRSVTVLLLHNKTGHYSFIMGNYTVKGVWYYFPVAFLVKTPVATLLLTLLLAANIIKTRSLEAPEKMLLLFTAFYGLLAVTSDINIGHRHILPLYPVLFVLMGRVYNAYIKKALKSGLNYIFPAAYLITTQIYYPNYLSFFNLFIRPPNGYMYFVDSNLDWGQDLPLLRKFVQEEGNPSLILSYFGTASRKHYGLHYQRLFGYNIGLEKSSFINPVDTPKEYLAVSATNLQGVYFNYKGMFKWLEMYRPVKKIGYSIFVYDITWNAEAAALLERYYEAAGMKEHAQRQRRRVDYILSRRGGQGT